MVFLLIVLLALSLYSFNGPVQNQPDNLSYSEFVEKVKAHEVKAVSITGDSKVFGVEGEYVDGGTFVATIFPDVDIASFLEEYDFSGKTILPFCSHGGGGLGQSQTAIAKLVLDANMAEGLAINYSGGSGMPDDVAAWLDANGIERQ